MFEDRKNAGKLLGERLQHLSGTDVVVYALPRGGVSVGAEIARAISAPLDIIVVRKIGHPNNPEYAIGALAENGVLVKNEEEWSRLDQKMLAGIIAREQKEIRRRRKIYTDNKRLSAKGKTAIIVDDGLATGFTMKAAIESVRKEKPKQIIVALPVAPAEVVEELRAFADDVVVLNADPNYLGAVGAYYHNFEQVSDGEVVATLKKFSNAQNV